MNALISVSSILLPVLLALNAITALRWSPTPKDGEIIYACADHAITLAWGYTRDPGDVIHNTEWTYEGLSHEMVAASVDSNFLPTPPFAHRVELLPDAGLILSHLTKADAGNYSVIVTGHDSSGVSFTMQRTVLVQVADDLMTTDHELHAAQQSVPEFNNETNQWHAVLTCGHFTYTSDPPVSVEWLTPDGKTLPSTLYSGGFFKVLLPNPVTDGRYTCRISPSAINVSCTHGDGQQDSVEVNGFMARLTLMEAQQQRLQAEQERLQEDNAKKDAMVNQLTAKMETMQAEARNQSTKVQTMQTELTNQSTKVQTMQTELTSQSTKVQTMQADLSRTQTEVRNLLSCCQAHGDHTPPTIAFTARLSSDFHLAHGATMVLTDVLVNEGGAYNSSTGRFTAPVTGIYHFSAMASPYVDANGSAANQLLKTNSATMPSDLLISESHMTGTPRQVHCRARFVCSGRSKRGSHRTLPATLPIKNSPPLAVSCCLWNEDTPD